MLNMISQFKIPSAILNTFCPINNYIENRVHVRISELRESKFVISIESAGSLMCQDISRHNADYINLPYGCRVIQDIRPKLISNPNLVNLVRP